jgi:hypothetical protein
MINTAPKIKMKNTKDLETGNKEYPQIESKN